MILLTARGDEDDRLRGLVAGATTTSPNRSHRESWPCVRWPCCGAPGSAVSTAALTNGPLVIDQARRTAHLDGVLLALSDVEFRLLTVLARHTGEVVGWRTILNEVWSTAETMGGRDMIKTTVYRLRQQLGPAAERLIVTVRGSGYLMPRQEDDGSPPP